LTGDIFYEPWKVSLDRSWEEGFKGPPPRHEHTDSEYAQVVANYLADRKKFEKRADSLIWGSQMEHPDIAVGLRSGKPIVFDDSGVIARIRGANIPGGGPPSGKLAKRIVDCVNAFRGVQDPRGFMTEIRDLLAELAEQEFDHPMVAKFAADNKEIHSV